MRRTRPAASARSIELDHGVVPELKRIGEVADDGGVVAPMAADGEEELVLRRRGAGAACGLLREALEDPQRVAEPRQRW